MTTVPNDADTRRRRGWRWPLRGRPALSILAVAGAVVLVAVWFRPGGSDIAVTAAGIEQSWRSFRQVAVTCVETTSPDRLLCSVGPGAREPVDVVCNSRSCVATAGNDSAVFPYRPE
jgi:hypothetical protein